MSLFVSIVLLQINVAMYVQKIEEWHRNNNVDDYTLHTFHRYGTACSLIASENFHRKNVLAKHFSYFIEGTKDNKDVMIALMMLSNPFFERRISKPTTRGITEDEQKEENSIAGDKSPTSTDLTTVSQQHQNKVKEIKVESDEEDDLNVPKYNRETFDAIFSCKRIACGTYEFTFRPEFKKLFDQFHVVNDIDANHGQWINLCRVSINDKF